MRPTAVIIIARRKTPTVNAVAVVIDSDRGGAVPTVTPRGSA